MKLKLYEPSFGSPLTDLILELDHLRRKQLGGSTPVKVFFQLKQIFHMLESIGSARIEGNNTTVAAFLETKIEDRPFINDDIQEIRNIEAAMEFVDETVLERGISKGFIKELHNCIVRSLAPPPSGEGDMNPGQFRNHPVKINHAVHIPPKDGFMVGELIDELVGFINKDDPPKYDLLKVAIAHHRFMWIHPFGNGNGRTGRLLTYAMLVSQGFRVGQGRILNPTAVFCIDRDRYNHFLSEADKGTDEGMNTWCSYVLQGLKDEIDKIDRLVDYDYLKGRILKPSLVNALKIGAVTEREFDILDLAVERRTIKNSDLQEIFPDQSSPAISRYIRELRKKKMLESEESNTRSYHIGFINNALMRSIIPYLAKEGFIPLSDVD